MTGASSTRGDARPVRVDSGGRSPSNNSGAAPSNLADVLERVLDKGIVIAGDIQVNLLDIELLTIKIRLLVVSVDKAAEMGIDWWQRDPMLSSTAADVAEENKQLRERIEALESRAGSDSVADDDDDDDEGDDDD